MTLAAGASKKLTLTLNATGRGLLARRGTLTALLEVRAAGKLLGSRDVRVAKVKHR